MPKKNKNSSQIVFAVDEKTVAWLQAYAKQHGATMGSALRSTLEQGLEAAGMDTEVVENKLVHAHVTAELRDAIQQIADRNGCSLSRACRHLVGIGVKVKGMP